MSGDQGHRGDSISTGNRNMVRIIAAAIAVFVILFFFNFVMLIILYYGRSQGIFHMNTWNEYPLYSALFWLFEGGLFALIAGFFVGGNSWHEALFDRLQMKPDRLKANYLAIGVIIGALSIVATNVLSTLIASFLYQGQILSYVEQGMLGEAAIEMVPRLIYCAGMVMLLQGYFQRTLADRYGPMAGICGAAILFTLMSIFSVGFLGKLLYPTLWLPYLLIGIIVAYLYHVSKTIYLPIGFIFAWGWFDYVSLGFFSDAVWFPNVGSIFGISVMEGTWHIRTLIILAILAIIWYAGRKYPMDIPGLKGRIKSTAAGFLDRMTRD